MATNEQENNGVTEPMNQPQWYTQAQDYWTNVEPTVVGMLGGFPEVNDVDAKGSLEFIDEFVHGVRGVNQSMIRPPRIETSWACDCGAGIGRVTKHFLLQVPFAQVDLVEQSSNFVDQARKEYLADQVKQGQVHLHCEGLQAFTPAPAKYDLIWCQWVLGHLTDDDLEAFLRRCRAGLKPRGLIGIKENISKVDYLYDEEDSSVTRSDTVLKRIIARADLQIIKEDIQRGLPAGLFDVKMYMLAAQESS